MQSVSVICLAFLMHACLPKWHHIVIWIYEVHPLLYLCGAQHIKVLPSPPVPGQSIMHTDTLVCAHIPVKLMEGEREGRDERGECRDKSAMRMRR